MAEVAQWTQDRFNRDVEALLKTYDSESWPRVINKKLARTAWKAYELTTFTTREKITAELSKEITGRRKDETTGKLPIGIAIAAKRASKAWEKASAGQKAFGALARGKRASELKRWRDLIKKKHKAMIGGRVGSSHYIQVGWISVLQLLAAKGIREAGTSGGGAKIHGAPKAKILVAEAGRLLGEIENIAHSMSENRGGFMRIGEPPLQRALDAEAEDIEVYLNGEMNPAAERFNRAAAEMAV